jgi:hypothetical protein
VGGGGRRLSLEEALELGQRASDGIEIATAGLAGAHGRRKQVRSQYFPQIGGERGVRADAGVAVRRPRRIRRARHDGRRRFRPCARR